MQLKKATRRKVKLKAGLFGTSGSGKTYSALLLAHGMVDDWTKIAVIDTENGSADLYSHLGDYNTLTLAPPFAPWRYIEAIRACEAAGMEVIIIDSISHEWEGKGGCLEMHDNLPGNSFTNWKQITPQHNRFIEAILQSPCHVICCGRVKTDYVVNQNDKGKQAPEKIGLKCATREGFDYELTVCFDIDIKHNAKASKDRTSLFVDDLPTPITEEHGRKLMAWVNEGAEVEAPKPKQSEAGKELQDALKALSNTYKAYEKDGLIDKETFAAVTGISSIMAITDPFTAQEAETVLIQHVSTKGNINAA